MEYELNRGVMWVFTRPLMLKMYCDVNYLSVWDINIHYHLIAIVPHVFVIPFKSQPIYLLSTILLSIPEVFFLKSLHKYKQLPLTNLYILIWVVFMLINILDITQLYSPVVIHALYNLADTLCKFICIVVIYNYNEQEIIVRDNMDLQSVQFVSHVIKSIKEFEKNNIKLTPFCRDLMLYCKKKFADKVPKSNEKLKLELLKKLLPFDLDIDYIRAGAGAGEGAGANKEFKMICIMFMDIVNYTELATRYNNCDTIFKLLNDIYYHFDNIIKKYSHLQKIETIGDAYMVVGDIYREELNHKVVVKEIILLGLEFIKEVKTIKTPDNIPLCIRIGINMGNVNIGILGNEIPRLCVVGNAVNISARLQTTAETDTIQMSRHIYEHAEEIDFGMNMEYIKKENVFLKNIGSITTYNLENK
jgi:class 3 adenylate cyclase